MRQVPVSSRHLPDAFRPEFPLRADVDEIAVRVGTDALPRGSASLREAREARQVSHSLAEISDQAGHLFGIPGTFNQCSRSTLKEGNVMAVPLSDMLQIWGFESGFTLFADGSYGFGLELSPVDVGCWDDDRIDALAARLGLFLNSLPAGIDFQLVQDIGKGNDTLIEKNKELGKGALAPTVIALHEARVTKLRAEDAEGLIPKHTLKAFVRRRPESALIEKPKLFSKPKVFEEIAEQALIRELNLTEQLRGEVIRSLASFEIRATPIEERKLAEHLYAQWNPLRQIELAGYEPQDIRSSLTFTDVSLSLGGFSIGEMHHRVISLKLLPDQTYSSMARALREFRSKP